MVDFQHFQDFSSLQVVFFPPFNSTPPTPVAFLYIFGFFNKGFQLDYLGEPHFCMSALYSSDFPVLKSGGQQSRRQKLHMLEFHNQYKKKTPPKSLFEEFHNFLKRKCPVISADGKSGMELNCSHQLFWIFLYAIRSDLCL
uniref:Uncharacterized protein n=1 Tax=Micrurus carvalhoi TaxID=3147026 RepID=A0A2H6N4T3_9SAUR